MPHAGLDRGLDQGAGVHGVVAVVAERIAHRIRHHDRAAKWMISLDRVLADELGDQRLVADIADDKRHRLRQRRAKSGGQIVEHDDALAGIRQRVHHMTADIAAAAGDQDGHESHPLAF